MKKISLEEINKGLKNNNAGVRVEQRGNRLYLVATLPPKPDSKTKTPHQQRISLKIWANSEGLRQAEIEAKSLSANLAKKRFSWDDYLPSSLEKEKNISDWIESFQEDYFSIRAENPKSLTTWKIDYLQPFLKLPIDHLTEDCLRKTILQTEPDTRTRRRYTLAFAKLADFAQIEHNLRKYIGDYSTKRVAPRSLPTDADIILGYGMISNAQWKWVYGMMSTYGLRNHEVFFTDLEESPIAFVNRGKSNERYTWPLFPEWADQWNLKDLKIPDCSGRDNRDYGNRVTHAFKRYGLPFSPYNLRHCWAVRSLEFGLDLSLAASQMGHSVRVHSETYHHWITKDIHQRAMNLILKNPNRPKPPC